MEGGDEEGEEKSEPKLSEQGEVFKKSLAVYRRHETMWGHRAEKKEGEGEAEGGEEKKEAEGEVDGNAEAKEEENKKNDEPQPVATSLEAWLESRSVAAAGSPPKFLHLPHDAPSAEVLSVAFIPSPKGMVSIVEAAVESNGVPGITWVLEGVDMGLGGEDEESGEEGLASTTEIGEGEVESATEKAQGEGEEVKGCLPHEQLFNSLTTDDLEQVKDALPAYEEYGVKNLMSEVTLGMVECLSSNPEDPVEFLADFLIKKGREKESKGREDALENFDTLLKHVDDMSSRLFDARTETSTFATGFSSAAKS